MSSIITAAILVAFIILICIAAVFVHNKDRKKMADELISHFTKVKEGNRLVFSSRKILKNLALGLDEAQRKCLIVRAVKNRYDSFVFQLDELKKCSREKIYTNINVGTQKKKKCESRLEKIVLEFEFYGDRPKIQIPFYELSRNSFSELSELDQQAKEWETIITEKINNKLKSTA